MGLHHTKFMVNTLKHILFVVLIFFMISRGNTQNAGAIEMGFGFGYNMARVSTIDGDRGTSYRSSFNGGVFGEYFFSDRWGLKMKLLYDRKGWSGIILKDDHPISLVSDYQLNYITLPVTANYHLGMGRNWHITLGTYFGVLLHDKAVGSATATNEAFQPLDFGIALGIGYAFKIQGSTTFYLEWDAQDGLTDIFDNPSGKTIRNSRMSINVGVLFL